MKLMLLLLALIASPAYAAENCTTLGWHFYCDPAKEPEAAPEPKQPIAIQPTAPNARARIKAIGEKLDELKASAILDPTPQNLIAYIRFQREQLDRASTFSDQWRRVIWQNPEMDYDLIRPTGSLAKRAWLDARKQNAAVTLANLNDRYGFFYFFKGSNCPQCLAFETALKPFADRHGLHVMAITLDSTPSAIFPASIPDSGQAARLGITGEHLPALALFDTTTSQVIPVGFGAMAADELERRIYTLTQLEVGHDY
jgi:conjugal transfer pilus assembly protein TraF